MLDACIELDNAIIDGHAGVTFGIHICRGNHKSMFYASGGYDRIAQHIFSRARFHRFLLEYDDERSGTFEPLRYVPDDRVIVLGLVSSKTPRMESEDVLRDRIAEAAAIVPLERLALSSQCGFASTHEGNRLSPDDQRRKLELVARTARAVWEEKAIGLRGEGLRRDHALVHSLRVRVAAVSPSPTHRLACQPPRRSHGGASAAPAGS